MHQCDECGKAYSRQSSLINHSRIHREREFECPACKKKFTYKQTLSAHILTHNDQAVASYVCDICGKTFKQRGGLHKHRAEHNLSKHICDSCGKQFYRREYLTRHIRTHGEKQECNSCKRLVYHLDKHICKAQKLERMHNCKLCNKSFKQKRYLWDHCQYMHKTEKTYECQLCDKVFNHRASLFNHRKHCKIEHSPVKTHTTSLIGVGIPTQTETYSQTRDVNIHMSVIVQHH